MKENFKQREKILDMMDSNIDARLALYESIKHTSFSTRSFIIGCGCGMTLGLMLAIIIINVC